MRKKDKNFIEDVCCDIVSDMMSTDDLEETIARVGVDAFLAELKETIEARMEIYTYV